MKNKEFYVEELLNIAFDQSPIAIDIDTEAPVKCDEIKCSKCLLNNKVECATPLREWSEKEFTFKLSNKEKAFLNMFTYKAPAHCIFYTVFRSFYQFYMPIVLLRHLGNSFVLNRLPSINLVS